MPNQTIRRILTILSLASASIAIAQSPASPATPAPGTWQNMTLAGPLKDKLFVVTFDRPTHRQTCRVQSFTDDKLVCSRTIGGPRTYLPQQVLALILPGDNDLQQRLFLGFNAALGAAIWATVFLAATCPLCAAGTAVAALFFFAAAGAIAYSDDQPNQLLYLAPNQKLSKKLGDVER